MVILPICKHNKRIKVHSTMDHKYIYFILLILINTAYAMDSSTLTGNDRISKDSELGLSCPFEDNFVILSNIAGHHFSFLAAEFRQRDEYGLVQVLRWAEQCFENATPNYQYQPAEVFYLVIFFNPNPLINK